MSKDPQAQSAKLQAVLQNQQAIATARAAVAQLASAIQQQQEQTDLAMAAANALAVPVAEREDLLADIATGLDRSAELAALDAREQQHKAAVAAGQDERTALAQTIAGLTRRLERTQAELDELLEARPTLIRALLQERAEAAGEKYVEVAQQLNELYRQIKGLGTEILNNGGSVHIGGHQFAIPSFDLAAVQPYAIKLRPHLIFTGIETHGEATVLAQKERAALRELGVEFD